MSNSFDNSDVGHAPSFLRTDTLGDRFTLRQKLGAGGFGAVYEVYDQARDAIVALKTLHQTKPQSLYRFKKEFRALSGLTHPNLVQLYELISDGKQWLFTMELIDGIDILTWTQGADAPAKSGENGATPGGIPAMMDTVDFQDDPLHETGPMETFDRQSAPDVDFDRLRAALRQLTHGLQAIHAAGKLHMDIKPPNVLVNREGRVVLLDFGMVEDLATETLSAAESGRRKQTFFAGTPHYMSPEQAMGHDVREGSDWYSVGVMLFEALTGRYPIQGDTVMQILLRKQTEPPPAADQFPPDTPDDLRRLCRNLLAPDPHLRPTGERILERLGSEPEAQESGSFRRSTSETGAFVGRAGELETLFEALRDVRNSRRAGIARIHGPSGMGKTVLAQRFISDVIEAEEALVFRGRCYENESVPYKAVDSLIDSICEYLKRLQDDEVATFFDEDAAALTRLFPVLDQLATVRERSEQARNDPDGERVRRRAFRALRTLLSRLSRRKPVVLFIDDVQWGDDDSAQLLMELLRPPTPAILLLTTHRSEDSDSSPFLRTYLDVPPVVREKVDIYDVPLSELSTAESHELAVALLGDERSSDTSAEFIAKEAHGNPLFIDELSRYTRGGELHSDIASIDDVIFDRFGRLPDGARKLLEVVAVAGQPVERAVVREAAHLLGDEQQMLAMLRNERLVRVKSRTEGESIEAYHDRIRETVRDRMADSQRRDYHMRLGQILERRGGFDPETLATHFREAGVEDRAARYALDAADAATEALAFDRATRLFREALRLGDWPRPTERQIYKRMGRAYGFLARGNDAAQAYLDASRIADDLHAIELRGRAADQLLRSGQVERGLQVLYQVLREVDLDPPPKGKKLLFSLLFKRARLWWRGRDYELREEPLPERERIRIDTLWTAANLMATVDVKLGAYFQMESLRYSLESGDATRIARSLSLEAVHLSSSGKVEEADALIEEALELSDKTEDIGLAAGWGTFAAALVDYFAGRLAPANAKFHKSTKMLEKETWRAQWEYETALFYQIFALWAMGRLNPCMERIPDMRERAEQRNDHMHATALKIWSFIIYLCRDEAEEGHEVLADAIEGWTRSGYHLQHFWHLQGRVHLHLFEGEGRAAMQRIEDDWPRLKASFLMESNVARAIALDLRARAALASVEGGDASYLRQAAADARRLAKLDFRLGRPLATLIRAQVAMKRGKQDEADEGLAKAETQFHEVDMALHAATCRWRMGQSIGPSRGAELVENAEAFARKRGAEAPAKLLRTLAPCKPGPRDQN